MFKAVDSSYLVPFDGSFKIKHAATQAPKMPSEKTCKKRLKAAVKQLAELQRILYANDNHAVLLVFQAMDAAGKDSTIRNVLSGVNPAGCHVVSFKQPSKEELEHDFLWRTVKQLPERGTIGVFNRSHYEEVLVVRVHPNYLRAQTLARCKNLKTLWQERYESIASHEQHLARTGTVILKFWLNISKDEQKNRFLSRLQEPEKHWKFSEGDLKERALWPKYMSAYEDALKATSKPWAPWYAIPADNKPYMRMCVAELIVEALESLNLHYPTVTDKDKAKFDGYIRALEQPNA